MDTKEVNKLYSKAFVTVVEASKLIGIHRQGVWYLIKHDKVQTKEMDGETFIDVSSLKDYVLKKRKNLLAKLDKLHLPT